MLCGFEPLRQKRFLYMRRRHINSAFCILHFALKKDPSHEGSFLLKLVQNAFQALKALLQAVL